MFHSIEETLIISENEMYLTCVCCWIIESKYIKSHHTASERKAYDTENKYNIIYTHTYRTA